jgi:hypothetical protein
MNIFPFISYEENVVNNEMPLYKEVSKNLEIVEGNEAIKIWIWKALKVPRYQYVIYSWNYGSELLSLIGKAYTRGLTCSEASRYIKEALLINPYILEVDVLSTSFEGDTLSAEVRVKTIYEGEVVVYV